MPNCSVVGCRIKKSENRPNITLHRMPKNDRRRKMWLDKIGVENLTSRTKTIFVCSLHFDESCFNRTLNITTLREDAVPSRIFLPPPALSSTSSTLSEVDPNQTPSSYKICDASDEVCRMCLVTSDRLFSIRTYNLEQAFEQLTGISLSEDDRLPQSLCSECATRLHNADSFRDRSLRAHNLMTDILKTNLHLTASALMSITTELQPKLHTKHYPANHCDVTLEHSDPTTEDIKSLEELDIKNEDEIFVDDLSPKEEAYADRGFDTDDSLPLEVAKKKKKKTQKKVKKIKTNEPKIDRRRKPFLNQDLNETLFTITDLTLEEQMAEVLKRQDTDNYKHSSFKCTECFKGFLDRDAYVSHMVRHTSECGEHRCDICKTHFKHSHALRKHITAHHLQRFSCNHCPYVTTHRQTARLHERWHKGTKYQCPHCNLEFLKFTTYMGHVRIKHPSDFVCELCGYSFVSAKGIELHKKLKHRGDDDVIPEDAPTCESCNVRFVSAEAYRRHLSVSARHATTHREHNKPTRSRKTMQDDREKSKNTDDDDKRRIYPSQMRKVEGPISCEQCGMQLEDSRAYHGHFRRMHPDKNRTNYPSMKSPCMCEVCGRIFQSFALLKDHTWVHTGERPFKCEQCGKSFRMKQRLVAHRRVHSEARTNYTCSLCGKHFSTHSNRQRHMFIHTGLKPFKCEMCGKGFKHASEKRAHVTYVHLKKPWPKRARTKRTHRPGSPNAGESEMDIQPAWPVCDPKLNDINMMDDKPLYYR